MKAILRASLLLTLFCISLNARSTRGKPLTLEALRQTEAHERLILGKKSASLHGNASSHTNSPHVHSQTREQAPEGSQPAPEHTRSHPTPAPQRPQPTLRLTEKQKKVAQKHLLKIISDNYGQQPAEELQMMIQHAGIEATLESLRPSMPDLIEETIKIAVNGPPKQSAWQRVKTKLAHAKQWLGLEKVSGFIKHSVVGKAVIFMWDKVWQILVKAVEIVIGKEAFYQVDASGAVLKNTNDYTVSVYGVPVLPGKPLPALVDAVVVDKDGRERVTKQVSHWYMGKLTSKAWIQALQKYAIDNTIKSALKGIDRAAIRPLVSATLGIPHWKLSHAHYMLYMYNKTHPNKNLLSPDSLAESIMGILEQRSIFTREPLPQFSPFDLYRIQAMSSKDPVAKRGQLKIKIADYLNKKYDSILNRASSKLPTGLSAEDEEQCKNLSPYRACVITRTDAKTARSITQHVKQRGTEFLKDLKRESAFAFSHGVLSDLKLFAMSAGGALSLIPFGIEMLGNMRDGAAAATRDLSGTEGERKLRAPVDGPMGKANALSNALNAIREYHDQIKDALVVIKMGDGTMRVLTPALQRELISVQEIIIDEFEGFIRPTLRSVSGNLSYTAYISRLLLPRIVEKVSPGFLQKFARTVVGDQEITMADLIARHHDAIGSILGASYDVIMATSDFIALIQEIITKPSFAGQYTRLFDRFSLFIESFDKIGKQVGSKPINLVDLLSDRTISRMTRVMTGKTSPKDKLSLLQHRRLKRILSFAPGITSGTKTAALMARIYEDPSKQEAWDALEKKAIQIHAEKNVVRAQFFASDKRLDQEKTEARIEQETEWLNKKIFKNFRTIFGGLHDTLSTLNSIYRKFGIREVLMEIDATGMKITDMDGLLLGKIAAQGVIPVIVGEALELTLGQFLGAVLASTPLMHNPMTRQMLMGMGQGALSSAERASGQGPSEGALTYRLGKGIANAAIRGGKMGLVSYGAGLLGGARAGMSSRLPQRV